MNMALPTILNEFHSEGLENFETQLAMRNCKYYASDFLKNNQSNSSGIDKPVQRTLQIFHTLNMPADEHFYLVFRCDGKDVYKDWLLSKLACIYLLFSGDPGNLESIAQQQSDAIATILDHLPE